MHSRLFPIMIVDMVDSNEIVFGLGAEPDGLTSDDVRRLVADVSAVADVVGLTIAEFIPRQVIRLQQVLRNFPLIGDPDEDAESFRQPGCCRQYLDTDGIPAPSLLPSERLLD